MSRQSNRLVTGGRIDRVKQHSFRFDGTRYSGFAGDTLASALIANGVKLVGRSFKYHRPRGIFSAGIEEPSALVTLRSGGRTEPNVPATVAELYDGLVARSQNAWPSLRLDLMAANGFFKPMLSAGFYYKTFMGPTRKSWMLFEPIIRKAAGLGAASKLADPDRYEKVNLFADVLIVGAGPAGLAAALSAGRMGARVVLADQQSLAGGALLDEPVGSAADAWLQAALGELATMANVRLMTRTTVFGAYDGGTFGLVERVADHKGEPDPFEPRQRYIVLRAASAVIATGAIERPIPFANNDRPGVMLAGAARTYLNRYGVVAGRRVIMMTNNDTAYAAAIDLVAAAAKVTVLDARPSVAGGKAAWAAGKGVEVIPGHAVAQAIGYTEVKGALIAPFDIATGHCGIGFRELPADLILVCGGWDPQVHLATQRGGKAQWRADRLAFLPTGEPDIQIHAGAMQGTFSTPDCLREGHAAGIRAATAAGTKDKSPDLAMPAFAIPDGDPGAGFAPVWDVHPPEALGHQKRFIDFQNDVSASDLELAHREGYVSVEHLKRYTTLGMATEQGKLANVIALAQMARLRQLPIAEVGTTGFRSPYTSVALGALAGHETDQHVRPVRRTPFHDWNVGKRCVFLDTGLWKRAWFYPEGDEDVNGAYRRETKRVRETVGMVDVSTLGKIDVQGPDAAEFLNRVYVNGWKTLEIGRARYGIMLREDGFILDDGTTSRLSEHHYFLTTTTAEAAKVMSHLEWLLQTAWPELKVHVTSVTDQWGGLAVAGPNARVMLAEAIPDVDFANDKLPFMGVRMGSADGIAVRVHRVSFSGELAYEVFCASGHGHGLARHLERVGARHGLVVYGVEALGALRIEKGHIAGAELDGRTTLEDLHMERMASKAKPYVGSVLRQRAPMTSKERQRLVGLKPVDRKQRIRPGSVLQPHNGPYAGHGLGHVTSTTYSPVLGHSIALGLIQGGEARTGQIVDACYPLKGDTVACEVVPHHFYDPEGLKQNG